MTSNMRRTTRDLQGWRTQAEVPTTIKAGSLLRVLDISYDDMRFVQLVPELVADIPAHRSMGFIVRNSHLYAKSKEFHPIAEQAFVEQLRILLKKPKNRDKTILWEMLKYMGTFQQFEGHLANIKWDEL